MASNARFHNKYHRRNHHTLPSAGYPDSGADPIASPQEPFLGDFHAVGALSATGNLTIGGNTLIYGNLSALGNFSFIDTFVTVTSALSVVNDGTGPAFTVQQKGAQPVAIFFDDSNKIFNLKDGLRAEFFNSNATNTYALAEGQATLAQGNASHSEGISTQAFGQGSHAEGAASTATGDYSHAEGDATQAIGNASHSEGDSTVASGEDSHAEGANTIASGSYSHAEGVNTRAAGLGSHAAGSFAVALHDRTWVWKGDTTFDSVTSTRTDQFMVSAAGGVYVPGNVGIGTDSIANALTVVGNVSASRSVIGTSLSGRFVDISHTPANDGSNPYLRIGEATSDAVNFSGFKIEYNETTNDLNLSAIGFNTSKEALKITSAGNTRVNLLSAVSPNYNNLTAVTRGISGAGLDDLSHLINGRVGINNQAPVSSYALHVKGGNIRVDGVDYSAVPGFDGTTYDSDGQSLFDLRSATPSANYSLSIAASGQKQFLKFFGGRTKRAGETDNTTFPFVVYQGDQHLRFAKTPDFYFAGGFTEVGKFDASGNFGVGTFNSSASLPAKLTVSGGSSTLGALIIGPVSGINSSTSFNAGSATGSKSFAANEGKAFGDRSFAEGNSNAWGVFSHAEGNNTLATGLYAHAEGDNTRCFGDYGAHAEGNFTTAIGTASHAEGLRTQTRGEVCHAAGVRATAGQNYTYAWSDGNLNTLTENVSTTRTGQYMVSASGGVFIPGNLGIGTDNNTFDLHVKKASAGATADTNSIAVFEGGGNAHISILTPDAQTGGVVFGSPGDVIGSYLTWNYGNSALKLATATRNGFIQLLTNDEAEAVRITSSGNVGVGTTVPAEKLTVNGNISASGATTTQALSVLKTNAGADAAITVLAGNASGDAASIFFGNNVAVSGHNRGQIRYYNGGVEAMAFSTSTVEAMRIRAGGQVGLGTTQPAEKLTVSGNISSNGTLFTKQMTAYGLDLVHIPITDGTDPILRIGESSTDSSNLGFSGAYISYDELTNVFGISSMFAPNMGVPAMSIDRNGNFFTSSNASPKMTLAYAMTSANFLLSATNTTSEYIPLFKVPSHVLYYVPGVDISFTVENFAGGNQLGTDQMPVFRLARNNSGTGASEMSVDVTPFTNTNLYDGIGWNRQSTNTQSGKAMALPGDTVYLKVKTGYNNTGGATTAYSILSGRVILTGYYILP